MMTMMMIPSQSKIGKKIRAEIFVTGKKIGNSKVLFIKQNSQQLHASPAL